MPAERAFHSKGKDLLSAPGASHAVARQPQILSGTELAAGSRARNRGVQQLIAGALVALIPSLVAPAGARAGVLTSATWLQVAQGFPMSRTGAQLDASGLSYLDGSATSIAVSLSYPAFSVAFFVPKTAGGLIDLAVTITQGGPQNVTATPSMAVASQGIPGTIIVMTANHALKGVNQSMYNIGANTLLQIPLSAGVNAQVTGSFFVLGITHSITVDFYAWTANARIFTGLTSKGVALPDVIAPGAWGLSPIVRYTNSTGATTTAGGGGVVTLVSIDCRVAQRRTASFTTLKLRFLTDHPLPEPSTLLLLGAAGLALLLRARRR